MSAANQREADRLSGKIENCPDDRCWESDYVYSYDIALEIADILNADYASIFFHICKDGDGHENRFTVVGKDMKAGSPLTVADNLTNFNRLRASGIPWTRWQSSYILSGETSPRNLFNSLSDLKTNPDSVVEIVSQKDITYVHVTKKPDQEF